MTNKKIQVLFIHGGCTFKNYHNYITFLKTREISIEKKIRWADQYFEKKLGNNFEVIKPRMPLADNAKYIEWKINFERYFPKLKNNLILIGASLGGIFFGQIFIREQVSKKIIVCLFNLSAL